MTGPKRKSEVDYEADRVLRWLARLPFSQLVITIIGVLSVLGIVYLVEVF